jgi:hypothetical protein
VLLVAVLSSAPFLLTSPFLLLLSVERKNILQLARFPFPSFILMRSFIFVARRYSIL